MNPRPASLVLLLLMTSFLQAQDLRQDLVLLERPFGDVLSARGSPVGLGREAGFLDAQAVGGFFASWSAYFVSCDDKYTFNSPILLDLASKVSASPLRKGFTVLVYPGPSFWIDEEGKVAALQYSPGYLGLPPGLREAQSLEGAVEGLGLSKGRIDGYFRFSPPQDLSGSGDILIQFEEGKATRVVLLSPSFHLPPAWEWGQSSSSGPEGRP